MATSQRSRVRKPESVQFWLCVGAVSLALHSSLLFGLERWAKVTVVQPDGGPIAVELVDAPDVVGLDEVGPNPIGPDAVAFPTEPDAIAQVPQKTDVKPDTKPEAKPEIKPDVQTESEPEVVQKPEPKRELKVPIRASVDPKNPDKKGVTSKPLKLTKQSETKQSETKQSGNPSNSSQSSPSTPRQGGSNTPATSTDNLPTQAGGGMRSIGLRFTRPQHSKESGDPDATLALTEFPTAVSASNLFPLKTGQDFDVKVGFPVSCASSTGNLCDASLAQIGELSITPPDGVQLSASEDIELETMIKQIFQNVRVASLTVKTDVIKKPSTFWYVTVKIR